MDTPKRYRVLHSAIGSSGTHYAQERIQGDVFTPEPDEHIDIARLLRVGAIEEVTEDEETDRTEARQWPEHPEADLHRSGVVPGREDPK